MTLGRGWTGGQNFRPAREVDVIYGHGLVKSDSHYNLPVIKSKKTVSVPANFN